MRHLSILTLGALLIGTASASDAKLSAQSIIVNPAQPELNVQVWTNRDASGDGNPTFQIGERIERGAQDQRRRLRVPVQRERGRRHRPVFPQPLRGQQLRQGQHGAGVSRRRREVQPERGRPGRTGQTAGRGQRQQAQPGRHLPLRGPAGLRHGEGQGPGRAGAGAEHHGQPAAGRGLDHRHGLLPRRGGGPGAPAHPDADAHHPHPARPASRTAPSIRPWWTPTPA